MRKHLAFLGPAAGQGEGWGYAAGENACTDASSIVTRQAFVLFILRVLPPFAPLQQQQVSGTLYLYLTTERGFLQ